MRTPVWNHRELIGYACSIKQAEKIIRNKLQNIPRKWKVTVKERDINLIDLPAGFVFSVHP